MCSAASSGSVRRRPTRPTSIASSASFWLRIVVELAREPAALDLLCRNQAAHQILDFAVPGAQRHFAAAERGFGVLAIGDVPERANHP